MERSCANTQTGRSKLWSNIGGIDELDTGNVNATICPERRGSILKTIYTGRCNMLWTIVIILLVLWALGFGFAGAQVGGFIHILLVLAVIVAIVQLVRGRSA